MQEKEIIMNMAIFRVALLVCASLTCSSSLVMAQAGRLDPTFGRGGKVLTGSNAPNTTIASAVTLQPDGKIIVAEAPGNAIDGEALGVVRYNVNGSLDSTFGKGGTALANLPGNVDSLAVGVGVQTDGKIVAGGTIYLVDSPKAFIGFGVVRFNHDGSLDARFGTGGTVITLPFNNVSNGTSAFALQPDGKILLAGSSVPSSSPGFPKPAVQLMLRYNTDGSLDSTFGASGIAILADSPTAMALQSDGKILVAGPGTVSRYEANGSKDTSFGIFGTVGAVGAVSALAVESDGKIVVAGTFTDSLNPPGVGQDGDLALVRYNSDGTVDETFGTRGGVLADFFAAPSSAAAATVLIQPDGKIVAGGQASKGGGLSEFAVARFTSLGILDTGFGTGGVVTTSFGNADSVVALALQADGKIVAAGNSQSVTTPGVDSFAVARYTAH